MKELYGKDISDSTVSRITDKILLVVWEWQECPLEEVYAVVFMDAIHYHVRSERRIVKRAVYPLTEIQQCVLHQFRNSTKLVSNKDLKKLMTDLKQVYTTPTKEATLVELELFKGEWMPNTQRYKSWHGSWTTLLVYFKYPEVVMRLICTTNAIEGFNRQLWKMTKSKTVSFIDESNLSVLFNGKIAGNIVELLYYSFIFLVIHILIIQ